MCTGVGDMLCWLKGFSGLGLSAGNVCSKNGECGSVFALAAERNISHAGILRNLPRRTCPVCVVNWDVVVWGDAPFNRGLFGVS